MLINANNERLGLPIMINRCTCNYLARLLEWVQVVFQEDLSDPAEKGGAPRRTHRLPQDAPLAALHIQLQEVHGGRVQQRRYDLWVVG